MKKICRNCHAEYSGRRESVTCSRKCATDSREQTGAKNPNWKGGNRSIAIKGQRYRAKYPDRYAAHRAVRNAIRKGVIIRRPCEKCSSVKSEAHHDDYAKLLSVRWLCKKHHLETHRYQARPSSE